MTDLWYLKRPLSMIAAHNQQRVGRRADLAITAKISDGTVTVRKAILVQAKLGYVDQLNTAEYERLQGQVQDMNALHGRPKLWRFQTQTGPGPAHD